MPHGYSQWRIVWSCFYRNMSCKEAAETLCVSERTIHKLPKMGSKFGVESRIKWRPWQPLCRNLFINLQYTHGRIPPATSDRGSEEGTRRALSPRPLSDNRGLPPLPYTSVHKRAQPTHQRMQTFSSSMNLINNLHIIMILPLSSFPPQGHKTPRGGATSD